MERGGFEPPKAPPTDLQSAPVDRLGTSPDAEGGNRTPNPLITNQVLYRLSHFSALSLVKSCHRQICPRATRRPYRCKLKYRQVLYFSFLFFYRGLLSLRDNTPRPQGYGAIAIRLAIFIFRDVSRHVSARYWLLRTQYARSALSPTWALLDVS